VVGILFGLLMMWLVFDQLWGDSAAVEMKRTFISNLRLLAQLLREPLSGREKTSHSNSVRETINANFDKVRSLADGVLFELGSPSRQQDLALRSRIERWQPQLRMVFIMQVALSRYRIRIPGFELPAPVATAQQEFDEGLANVLEGMADRMSGKTSDRRDDFRSSVDGLEKTIRTYGSGKSKSEEALVAQFGAFLSLSRRIASLTIALDNELSVHGETLWPEM
jgi:multidrug resistance protein MdtO